MQRNYEGSCVVPWYCGPPGGKGTQAEFIAPRAVPKIHREIFRPTSPGHPLASTKR